ncbi:MAG: hypothetical protein LBS27_10730 [Bifidobacteriaceae bacterium]|nr:hypothetical protein [Bifidobacteriaceae bacterium]
MITVLAALAAAAWLILPGVAIGLAVGMRGLSLAALAPALTLAGLGGGSLVASWLGLAWGPLTALAATALGALVAWAVSRIAPIRAPRLLGKWSRREWLTVGGAGAVATGFIFATNLAAMGGADALPQSWDMVFHGNLVRFIRETGDASPFHAGLLNSPGATTAYYPSGVHAVAALLPESTQVWPALNMVVLVAASAVWVVGLIYLARVLFPASPVFAVVAAGLAVLYQGQPTSMVGLIANAVGVALLPGLVGWSVQLARVVGVDTAGRVARSLILLVAVVGAGLAHPNVMFSYAVVASPIALYIVVTVARRGWRAGYRFWTVAALAGLASLLGAGVWALYGTEEVQAVVSFGGWTTSANPVIALGLAVTDATTLFQVGPNLLVVAGLATGAAVALKRHRRRWLILAFTAVLVLYIGAVSKIKLLEPITALWYSDRTRLGPVLTVAGIPLILWGLQWVQQRWRDGRSRPVIAVVACLGLVSALTLTTVRPFRLHAAYYRLAETSALEEADRFFSSAELDMIKRLATRLEPNGLVLGDPATGAAFLYSVLGQPVVFPHLTGSWDQPRRYLLEHFADLGDDPKVCDALRQLDVEYVYLDTATFRDNDLFAKMTKGLRIDANLALIDQADGAAVYRINACGGA